MKALPFSPLTSAILKLVGIVLVLYYLIDLVVYLTAANFQNSQWVLTLTTQLVDRGFLPLLGIALLFTGFWIESVSAVEGSGKSSSVGLKLSALWLSSVLGLAFLLLVPVHVNATRVAADDQIKQIEQEATKTEGQLNTQVQQLKGQVDAQLNLIDQAIKAGQLQGDQLEQAKKQQEELQKLKADPKALDARVAPDRERALKQIQDRKKELEDQTRRTAMQTGMRIGLNSLLLAIGYAIVGWTGLRQMFAAKD